jgi:uncharacterized RDD family membrane protein YckC
MDIFNVVLSIVAINLWLTCFVKGFFPKQKRIGQLLTMTIVCQLPL